MSQPTVGAFTSRHMSVLVKDGTGTPITATLGPGPGDFQAGDFEEGNTAAVKILNRGDFQELVYGEDNEIPFSITCYMVGDQTGESITDAINKTGNFASAVTKDPGGVVYTLDLTLSGTRGGVSFVYTFSNCRLKYSFSESLEGNKLNITGVCYVGCAVT